MSTLNGQARSSESRPYRMRKRAEQVGQTRLRITEAAVRLHTTVGPARTTISGVADEAGVTRLTVYRHFPDEEALFTACTAHWAAQHPGPDAERWRAVTPLAERARHALQELYGWYRDNGEDLFPIYRDVSSLPALGQRLLDQAHSEAADALVAGSGARGRARRRLRATAGHVVSFWTWRSLAVDERLPHDDAVTLAAQFFSTTLDAAGAGPRR